MMSLSFEDTRLPDTPLIRKAFDRCVRYASTDIEAQVKERGKAIHRDLVAQVEQIKAQNRMSAEEYKKILQRVKIQEEALIAQERKRGEASFYKTVVTISESAKKLTECCDEYGEQAAIARLIFSTARTPMDFKDIEKTFGAEIGGVIAENREVTVYPEKTEFMQPGFSPAAKLLMLVENAKRLERQALQMHNLPAGQMILFEISNIIESYKTSSQLFGVSKRADDLYMKAFNEMFDGLMKSGVRIKREEDGSLGLSTEDVKTDVVSFQVNAQAGLTGPQKGLPPGRNPFKPQ